MPRTGTLEANDRNVRSQGPRIQTQVLSKKKGLQNFFQAISKKSGLKKFFLQPIYKILTIQKIVLSSNRGQDNFRGLAGFEAKDFKMCPRGNVS